jgi:lipopolysaccharide assembly outer membrane protein LptD (OstA)
VTPKWSLEGRTGYDLVQNKVATTSINVSRDLGCWVMSFSWVPFGVRQSYSFNLQVKSGQLSQLLRLNIPRTGEGPLGGFGNRLRQTAGGALGAGGGTGRPRF